MEVVLDSGVEVSTPTTATVNGLRAMITNMQVAQPIPYPGNEDELRIGIEWALIEYDSEDVFVTIHGTGRVVIKGQDATDLCYTIAPAGPVAANVYNVLHKYLSDNGHLPTGTLKA